MNSNQTVKNNCRNSGSPFISRRSKGNSPGNRKKDRSRTSPKRNSPKHRQNHYKRVDSLERARDQLITVQADKISDQHVVDKHVVDKHVVDKHKQEVRNRKENTRKGVEHGEEKEPLLETNIDEQICDQKCLKNRILLSPNGEHISVVSSSNQAAISVRHSTVSESNVSISLQTCNKIKNKVKQQHTTSVTSSVENLATKKEESFQEDSYARKLNDSLDSLLEDADPTELIYDHAAHMHTESAARRRRSQAQHLREKTQTINDSREFKGEDSADKDYLSQLTQKNLKIDDNESDISRHNKCVCDVKRRGEDLKSADRRNNNAAVSSRCTRTVLASDGAIHGPDTTCASDEADMGEMHRVMRRYKVKNPNQIVNRPRSELVNSTKCYERHISTEINRTRNLPTCRPVSMYELNGRITILQNAALQHKQLQQQQQQSFQQQQQQQRDSTSDNDVTVRRRSTSQRKQRSKYATMRPLSLSSVEDTMSVLAGYQSVSSSTIHRTSRPRRPVSMVSPQQFLRNTSNNNVSTSEMHITTWPECEREFITQRNRKSLPVDFDKRLNYTDFNSSPPPPELLLSENPRDTTPVLIPSQHTPSEIRRTELNYPLRNFDASSRSKCSKNITTMQNSNIIANTTCQYKEENPYGLSTDVTMDAQKHEVDITSSRVEESASPSFASPSNSLPSFITPEVNYTRDKCEYI